MGAGRKGGKVGQGQALPARQVGDPGRGPSRLPHGYCRNRLRAMNKTLAGRSASRRI
jgi:hypothetical protein